MKVITRIEVMDVPEDRYRMESYPYEPYTRVYSSDNIGCKPVKFDVETIKGRRFCRNEECTYIGLHSGVEKLLELPMECFDNVQGDLMAARVTSRASGYKAGKDAMWDFLKLNGSDTDYWWLPIPLLMIVGILFI